MSAVERTSGRPEGIHGATHDLGSARVVVVDDDERSLHVLTSWLESLGFEAHAFTSGRAAIAHVAHAGADVALIGSHAADMSGLQVRASMCDTSRTRAPSFVRLAGTNDGIEANDPAFDAVVRKPCSLDALLSEIARLTPRAPRGAAGAG